MCRNGQYTERGIKQIDGFMSERWRIEPGFVVKVPPSLGLLGVLRMRQLGQDDRLAWLLIPLLGLAISAAMVSSVRRS